MLKVNAFQLEQATSLDAAERSLIERRQRLLGPAYQLFYDNPLHFVRGAGTWLYDKAGRAYLDLYNNVASVGHCHPRVVEALASQAATLNTHTRYLHEGVLDYAEKLLATMPAELANVMFTCTGSEANDLALRIARDYTGGTGVIVTRYAYHGMTASIAELSPSVGDYVPLGRDIRVVDAPVHLPQDPQRVGQLFADQVRDALADMQRHGIRPAALLVDTLFTSDGVFADPAGFLAEAVKAVRDAGGLFIADEVQPGFGRTGTHMWGFQRHDVVPDLVTMGKPMGNGHPLAGLTVRPEILERFGRNASYFNTFGGNPVSAAVGLAVLQVIEEEGLQENARQIGALLKEGLEGLAREHACLGQVRGAGLFIGVDVIAESGAADSETARRIVNLLREESMLIGVSGANNNALKIRPQLCFSAENVEQFLGALQRVLVKL
ncbi:TPA: aspartate aminotransferase family protein [Pseudomonas aeruginosa]|jgi:4-aminobutyrate aminotransferase-like enzyme|uniref:aspartate aminotransferase family protein n=1 Tax=Pseudomonas TaxID=286 RepID=UPI0028ABFB76|nr:aspartate aminotransferase family protein [Pseudomonas sp.]EIU1446444.1 aspartate aminotransferase family protein [Pseudomonas aeruginosa]ELY3119089.1 aspartate aminotransferase family protein [Pseudomonas aeruginosa]HEJ1785869.1 aspartate aminotransferase family protein [Pseudomonas aeruginosa]HEJ2581089.1 aspartate aminotransferase family protein [Pseudomonas aeruginosa]HEJ6257477.1 aspartate aminotransferase family protein [Pseudomonas aeruginosa]